MKSYKQSCDQVGPDSCMIVFYEQLVLNKTLTLRKLTKFLDIPWSDSMLSHEKYIGERVQVSEVGVFNVSNHTGYIHRLGKRMGWQDTRRGSERISNFCTNSPGTRLRSHGRQQLQPDADLGRTDRHVSLRLHFLWYISHCFFSNFMPANTNKVESFLLFIPLSQYCFRLSSLTARVDKHYFIRCW